MNIALIIAGGQGVRTGFSKPKQFFPVGGIPVLAYVMKRYQDHCAIDAICVVALRGWEDHVWQIAQQYKITKLAYVATGGPTGQQSIWNGLKELGRHYSENDFVLIHDAVRPIIPKDIIDDALVVAQQYGNAVSVAPIFEQPLNQSGDKFVPYAGLYRAQAPQCFRLGELTKVHIAAQKRGIANSATSAALMIEMGHRVFYSRGTNKNIKLTTSADFEIFQAILNWGPDEYNFDI